MSKVITVRINFDVNTKSADDKLTSTVIQAELVERLLLRTLSLVHRLTDDEDLNTFISLIQRAIALINQLQIAGALLAASSGNPLGIALAAVGLAGAVLSTTDMAGSYA